MQFVRKGTNRPTRWILAAIGGGAMLASVLPWSGSAAADATSPTAVAVVRRDGTATVSWSFPPDTMRTQFEIATMDTTRGDPAGWGTRFAGPFTTATTIDGLLPGRSYSFTIMSVGGRALSASTSGRVPSGACTWGSCAVVDTNVAAGSTERIAQGFLHTLTAETPADLVSPLGATSWRIAPYDNARYAAVRAAGGTVTMVLSDAWLRDNADGSRMLRSPWQDWDAYAAFVQQTVEWHEANGMAPDYWDIQNEPDAAELYATTPPPTRELVLQQFEAAYAAIKQVSPNARIVGPSLATAAVSDPVKLVDFDSFFADAVAHEMRYDAISWHENGYGPPGSFEGGSRAISEHIAWVRKALHDHPTLGSPPLFVNEYGANFAQGNPAAEVGYISALERGGVASATHSCFPSLHFTVDTCADPRGLLDGLLTPSGQPTAAWWVHRDYGVMAGTRVFADGNEPAIVAYATRAATGEIDVVVGNDFGCNSAIDSTHCPADSPVARPVTPRLTVTAPIGGPSSYTVRVERMPYQTGALRSPQTVLSGSVVNVSGGAVVVSLPTLAVGDAVFITLTPQTVAGGIVGRALSLVP